MSYEPKKCTECGEAGHAWWDHEDAKVGGYDPLEPYFDEHITTDGVWITSRAQRRAIMNKNDLDYKKTGKVKYGTVLYFDRKV